MKTLYRATALCAALLVSSAAFADVVRPKCQYAAILLQERGH